MARKKNVDVKLESAGNTAKKDSTSAVEESTSSLEDSSSSLKDSTPSLQSTATDGGKKSRRSKKNLDDSEIRALFSQPIDPHKVRITGLSLNEINDVIHDLDENGMPKRKPNRVIIYGGANLFDLVSLDEVAALNALKECEIEFCYEPEIQFVKKARSQK